MSRSYMVATLIALLTMCREESIAPVLFPSLALFFSPLLGLLDLFNTSWAERPLPRTHSISKSDTYSDADFILAEELS